MRPDLSIRTLLLGSVVGALVAPITAAPTLGGPPAPDAGPARGSAVVRVAEEGGGYKLLRDGRPYFIKGAGGSGPLDALARAGGNSVRTWGADKAGEVLDEAQRHGLTVTVGIWLGHERHGF